MKEVALLFMAESVSGSMIVQEGTKFASYLTIIAILVSFPAFVSLYLHVRRTNLGKILLQPFLAMFIGFLGIMINSVIDIWEVFQGTSVTNITMLMSINRAISSVLIAFGCVMLFFSAKDKGLFSLSYYQHKKRKK